MLEIAINRNSRQKIARHSKNAGEQKCAIGSELGQAAEAMVDNFSITMQPLDRAVAALPRVDFALSYKDQTLRGNNSTGFFTPLKVSNWEH